MGSDLAKATAVGFEIGVGGHDDASANPVRVVRSGALSTRLGLKRRLDFDRFSLCFDEKSSGRSGAKGRASSRRSVEQIPSVAVTLASHRSACSAAPSCY
jgi:hypothetical protein